MGIDHIPVKWFLPCFRKENGKRHIPDLGAENFMVVPFHDNLIQYFAKSNYIWLNFLFTKGFSCVIIMPNLT